MMSSSLIRSDRWLKVKRQVVMPAASALIRPVYPFPSTRRVIPRPTPLPDLVGWLTAFSGCFTTVLPPAERQEYLECVRDRIRPQLSDAVSNWTADYVRLRFAAQLTR